jgi:hypothetical protein
MDFNVGQLCRAISQTVLVAYSLKFLIPVQQN